MPKTITHELRLRARATSRSSAFLDADRAAWREARPDPRPAAAVVRLRCATWSAAFLDTAAGALRRAGRLRAAARHVGLAGRGRAAVAATRWPASRPIRRRFRRPPCRADGPGWPTTGCTDRRGRTGPGTTHCGSARGHDALRRVPAGSEAWCVFDNTASGAALAERRRARSPVAAVILVHGIARIDSSRFVERLKPIYHP